MSIEWSEGSVVAERFRLTRLLGRGGMGSVWQATHLGLDVPCAIKFIDGEVSKLAEAHQRFENEAKAAAQLRSPHVVQIFDHGVFEGKPYIVMEFLDGEDLGKRLARVGKLPPREVSAIVGQIARALGRAHAVGIVHRDLKPDNVFLVKDDEREIVKVVDFGIAKGTGPRFEGSRTRTGALMGTPYYMSPEQAQGAKTVDGRSDLWSLAVIVYQALTGQLPFEGEALGDLFVKIIVGPMPVPSSVAEVPAGFDAFWAKTASRDPSQRYPTAREFADALALICEVVIDPASTSSPPLDSGLRASPTPSGRSEPRATPSGGVDPLAISSAAPLARSGDGSALAQTDRSDPPSMGSMRAAGVSRARSKTALLASLTGALAIVLVGVALVSAHGRSSPAPVAATVDPPTAGEPARAPLAPEIPLVPDAVTTETEGLNASDASADAATSAKAPASSASGPSPDPRGAHHARPPRPGAPPSPVERPIPTSAPSPPKPKEKDLGF